MRTPWLHPHRADVLAAIALVARSRQPLDRGLARLADGDPLLRPWSERLGPALASGQPVAEVLHRHSLIDRRAAQSFAAEPDPIAACDRLARDSLAPVRGLMLIRWIPVAVAGIMMVPLVLLQFSGVIHAFETVFRDLNIRLPALTEAMLDRSWVGAFLPVLGGIAVWFVLLLVRALRGLRHLTHLWWVEVHRQAALLEVIDAAILGDDAPRRLAWPWSWCAKLRISAWRQQRPAWDRSWRTWRILSRWRVLGAGWREAARAPTAAGVLRALGMLPEHASATALEQLRATVRQRLVHAIEPAHLEAKAMLMVAFAIGLFLAIMALFLPLISIVNQLNSSGG